MKSLKSKTAFYPYMFKNMSMILMILALLIPLFLYIIIYKTEEPYDLLDSKIELLSNKIALQESFISEIFILIEGTSKSGDANVDNVIQVNQISKKVEQLELNYKELQDVIIGNPSNIIEFALLLKEVDSLKDGFVEHKQVIYAEIERSFGLFRWFIYINIFIALTILGSFITSYLQSKKT